MMAVPFFKFRFCTCIYIGKVFLNGLKNVSMHVFIPLMSRIKQISTLSTFVGDRILFFDIKEP